jgi:hypothetical protein
MTHSNDKTFKCRRFVIDYRERMFSNYVEKDSLKKSLNYFDNSHFLNFWTRQTVKESFSYHRKIKEQRFFSSILDEFRDAMKLIL